MSLLFHKTFASGLTGATGFDLTAASNGTIAQSGGAGLNGTTGGVTVTKDVGGLNINTYGQMATNFTPVSVIRSAWWIDPSLITVGTNNHGTVFLRCLKNLNDLLLVSVIRLSGVLNLRVYLYNDSGVHTNVATPLLPLNWMEVRIQRASDGSTANGNCKLYCGGGSYSATGELVLEAANVLCYTRFSDVDISRLGMNSVLVSQTLEGSMKIDEWTLRDDDEPILFGVSGFQPAWARGSNQLVGAM